MAADGRPGESPAAYARRIAAIARELGIAADYGSGRQLELQPEARDLRSVGPNPDGVDVKLEPGAAAAWNDLRRAAHAAGIELLAISGFRSVARQVEIIREKLAKGESLEEILRLIAAPGFSEHHSGRAIDIGAPDQPPLVEGFAATPAFAWLSAHAREHRFRLSFPRDNPHRIGFEPWHWYKI
jgi:D-alanyl-D-alanine carboxypeptidase